MQERGETRGSQIEPISFQRSSKIGGARRCRAASWSVVNSRRLDSVSPYRRLTCARAFSQGRCGPVKILVVGSGGREHALAWKLKQSSGVARVFCAPGNAGTEEIGENVAIKAGDIRALRRFANENSIALTVVGPDDSLAAGIVDDFESEGL